VIAGDTGFSPGHAHRLAPGKPVRHTMNAAMVFRDSRLWGVLGTPGADNQVQVNLQALVAMLDFDADPQTALELPRWSSNQAGQGANHPWSASEFMS
jgi:gamma-glutamyltranspeptidase/glutathione hydrolase